MPEDVWPISARNPGPGSLYSLNGIGFGLKGFTRTDASGYFFATRWFMIIGLPIVPLGRYYVRQARMTPKDIAGNVTRYDVAGTARLHPGEILRTYAFCWLTPLIGILPLIALLERADDFSVWISITAVAVWPTTVIVLCVWLLLHYRKHWAPLREVRWRRPD